MRTSYPSYQYLKQNDSKQFSHVKDFWPFVFPDIVYDLSPLDLAIANVIKLENGKDFLAFLLEDNKMRIQNAEREIHIKQDMIAALTSIVPRLQ